MLVPDCRCEVLYPHSPEQCRLETAFQPTSFALSHLASRHRPFKFARLFELLVQLASPDGLDQRIDDTWQFFERSYCNRRLPLLELDAFRSNLQGHHIATVLIGLPP